MFSLYWLDGEQEKCFYSGKVLLLGKKGNKSRKRATKKGIERGWRV
jgi:hypothetical protein